MFFLHALIFCWSLQQGYILCLWLRCLCQTEGCMNITKSIKGREACDDLACNVFHIQTVCADFNSNNILFGWSSRLSETSFHTHCVQAVHVSVSHRCLPYMKWLLVSQLRKIFLWAAVLLFLASRSPKVAELGNWIVLYFCIQYRTLFFFAKTWRLHYTQCN